MSSRTRPSRIARIRTLLAFAVAITLMVWFAADHRAELTAIYDRISPALPFASEAKTPQVSQEGQWLEDGPTSIDPQQLAGLDIAEQDRSADDYERDHFGNGWASTGGGCDIRDEILERDLVEVTYEHGSACDVADGVLHDPYTGDTIEGDLSETVQIDHIVSLGDAWYSGAQGWSAEERETFANDPDNLVAVDAPANMSKSDDSISEWYADWQAPSQRSQCRFAAQYVDVVASYDLSVTSDDYKLLKQLETDCQDLT